MSKKSGIIISIIGILIILLGLLGFTYGYYLTRIQGNTNLKSISVESARLSLIYEQESEELVTSSNIQPGSIIGEMTFTVHNNGTAPISEYGVFIENVINTFYYTDHIKVTLTCESSDGIECKGYNGAYPKYDSLLIANSIDIGTTHTYHIVIEYMEMYFDQSIDMGKTIEGKIQIYTLKDTVDMIATVSNYEEGDYVVVESDPKIVPIVKVTDENVDCEDTDNCGIFKVVGLEPTNHTVTIYSADGTEKGDTTFSIKKSQVTNISGTTVTVNEASRTISANFDAESVKITPTKVEDYNPFQENTLAYQILKNAYTATNSNSATNTHFSSTPLTIPGRQINEENERTLSVTQDDLGTSYYFRGNVQDNYVTFNNKCWRILRIEGDGSVKLILADNSGACTSNITSSSKTGSSYIGKGKYGYKIDPILGYLANYNSSDSDSMKTIIESWYNNTETGMLNVQEKLKQYNACLGYNDEIYDEDGNAISKEDIPEINDVFYKSGVRLYGLGTQRYATLICGNDYKTDLLYATGVTQDEVMFAGLMNGIENANNYLTQNATSDKGWKTITLIRYTYNDTRDRNLIVLPTGYIGQGHVVGAVVVGNDSSIRPTVTLLPGTRLSSGSGTAGNAYIIQ